MERISSVISELPPEESATITTQIKEFLHSYESLASTNPLTREKNREAFPMHVDKVLQLKEKLVETQYQNILRTILQFISEALHSDQMEKIGASLIAIKHFSKKESLEELEVLE